MVLTNAETQNLKTQVISLPYASLLIAPLLHHNPKLSPKTIQINIFQQEHQQIWIHHDSVNEVEQMLADD
jgi:hypothetical protein